MGSWIQTYNGHAFDFEETTPDMVDIEDVAHALACKARYNGHTVAPYSVAQHCVLIAGCAPRELKLAALLHDAAEAYTGDMVSPLKRLCPDFKLVEKRIEAVICEKFGVDIHDERIKSLDMRILINEKDDLFKVKRAWEVERHYTRLPIGRIAPWSPRRAKRQYLEAFERYMEKR